MVFDLRTLACAEPNESLVRHLVERETNRRDEGLDFAVAAIEAWRQADLANRQMPRASRWDHPPCPDLAAKRFAAFTAMTGLQIGLSATTAILLELLLTNASHVARENAS